MQVLIVTEADVSIGLGHLKRCSILAKEAKNQGLEVIFYLLNSNLEAKGLVLKMGYALSDFNSLEDALRNRDYATVIIDVRDAVIFPNKINTLIEKQNTLLIDDISSRNMFAKYSLFTPAGSVGQYESFDNGVEVFGGWEYLIVNQHKKLANSPKDCDLLITFGASDPYLLSELMLLRSKHIVAKYKCKLILGPLVSPDREKEILELARESNCEVVQNPLDFQSLIASSKLVIGSFGNLFYESILIGTPIISIYKSYSEIQTLKQDRNLQDLYFFEKSVIEKGSNLSDSISFIEAIEDMNLKINNNYEFKFNGINIGGGSKRIIDKILSNSIR